VSARPHPSTFRVEPVDLVAYYPGMRGLDGDAMYRTVSTLLAAIALLVVIGLILWGLTPS
jgi:hypothetical protein